MTKRKASARKAWVTIRQLYPKGELAKRAWETRRWNQIVNMTNEEYEAYIIAEHEKEHKTNEHKRIRNLIRQAGGINDRSYENIPRWCKRKNGHTLDLLVSELAEEGIPVTCADDLYQLLQEVSA